MLLMQSQSTTEMMICRYGLPSLATDVGFGNRAACRAIQSMTKYREVNRYIRISRRKQEACWTAVK